MRVLVIDDDPTVRTTVRRALAFDGHHVVLAEDGEQGLGELRDGVFELVVLDVSMPGIDGFEVCRRIRAGGDEVPVLMLTARDAIAERVGGLDAGADDYVVKPFDLDEFLARVRALGRRHGSGGTDASGSAPIGAGASAAARGMLRVGDVALDIQSWEGVRGERRFELTRIEGALLELLLRHPRQVLTREVIFEAVWGHDFGASSNTHEVHLSTLRRKLEAGGEPRVIHNRRGVGYVLQVDGG